MSAWQQTLGTKPLQLISVSDIGHYAALSFADPSQYNGQAIGLAGDELNYDQIQEKLQKTKGYGVPATYGFLGKVLLYAMGDMGKMMNWFKTDGYGVDIQALRRQHPALMNFESWLEKKSKFQKQG